MISSIRFDEFKKLAPEEKEKLIWKYAIELMQRNEEIYSFILYQLNAFYIEIVYSVSLNIVLSYKAFEDVGHLDNYLSQIDIDFNRLEF